MTWSKDKKDFSDRWDSKHTSSRLDLPPVPLPKMPRGLAPRVFPFLREKPWIGRNEDRVTCTLLMLSLSTHDHVIESSMPFNSFVKVEVGTETVIENTETVSPLKSLAHWSWSSVLRHWTLFSKTFSEIYKLRNKIFREFLSCFRTFCFLKEITIKCLTSCAADNVFLFIVSNYKDKCVCSFFFLFRKLCLGISRQGKNTKTLNLKQLPKHTIYNTEHKLKPI